MSVAAVGAGVAAVGGAYIASQGAKSAANAQAGAANAANALTESQYRETQGMNAPFREAGVGANNLLAQYLGIPGYQNGPPPSAERIIALKAGEQYDQGLTQKTFPGVSREKIVAGALQNYRQGLYGDPTQARALFGYTPDTSAGSTNPLFGSLLKPFSQADLDADPIYQNTFQFALDNGNKAINQQAAATGGILNGNTLKALSRFGANTAATYGNDAFNRNSAEKTRIYNSLAGVSGAGQQATNQVSAAGQNAATTMGNNLIGVGNARGASAIAGANSFNNALSQGINGYQTQQLMNSLNQRQNQNYFGWSGMNGFGDSYGTSYGE